jgi:hypothetical protein
VALAVAVVVVADQPAGCCSQFRAAALACMSNRLLMPLVRARGNQRSKVRLRVSIKLFISGALPFAACRGQMKRGENGIKGKN